MDTGFTLEAAVTAVVRNSAWVGVVVIGMEPARLAETEVELYALLLVTVLVSAVLCLEGAMTSPCLSTRLYPM